jgi:ribosomal protein S12 methylthiotransferase accessory factor
MAEVAALGPPRRIAEVVARRPTHMAEAAKAGETSQAVRAAGSEHWAPDPGHSQMTPAESAALPNAPLLALLARLGCDPGRAAATLAGLRIGIVGLEAHGARLALILAQSGIDGLDLADPYPCEPQNIGWVPELGAASIGRPRAEALAEALARLAPALKVATFGTDPLRKEDVDALVAHSHLVVGCFDRGFSAAQHWVNRSALAHGRPALFGELSDTAALAGPLVIPGETACWMCYRMRSLANAERFDDAMALEEHLDARCVPALHLRAVAPGLPDLLAGLLASELIRQAVAPATCRLAGRLHCFDGVTLQAEFHPVLERADCPVCKKKVERGTPRLVALLPRLAALLTESAPPDARDDAVAALVSPRTGVIRALTPLARDPMDPVPPVLARATLANHRFAPQEAPWLTGFGKGATEQEATMGALGEAVERYAATAYDPGAIRVARRGELDVPSLDPSALVLYADEQYRSLPFARWREDSRIGWVPGMMFPAEQAVAVPALAVVLDHPAHAAEENLFTPNSSGLAAGSSLAAAILAAAGEVIERDAYMITWLQRLPCPAVSPETHPDPIVASFRGLLARRGFGLRLHRLPTDHAYAVFLALALADQPGEPAAVIALGSDPDAAAAARKAVLELAQGLAETRARLRTEAGRTRLAWLEAGNRPVLVNDHSLLYASMRMRPALDFLLCQPETEAPWMLPERPYSQAAAFRALFDGLARAGSDLVVVDLTPPEMARLNLFAVRAILTNHQPLDFGEGERRLGGRRLFDLPLHLGLPAARDAAGLNPDPHPMA